MLELWVLRLGIPRNSYVVQLTLRRSCARKLQPPVATTLATCRSSASFAGCCSRRRRI